MMTADEFRQKVANSKGGEVIVYFSGRLSEKAETSREIWDLAQTARQYPQPPLSLGVLVQRKILHGSDYLFIRSKEKPKRKPQKGERSWK